MSTFSDFENAVVAGVKDLAKGSLKDYLQQAQDDAKDYLVKSRQKLALWTAALASGDLSGLEFEGLVNSEAGLAAMEGLKQVGIAAADIQRFRDALIKLVIDSAFKAFLP